MVRVVFIDLEVWKDPERVFQIGAIRRDLKNLGELICIEGEIKIPKDANKLKNGCFKDKKSGCDCFYAEIDRKQNEKDYTQDAKNAFAKLMAFSLQDTDKSINDIYLCGHNIIRFDSKYIEEYWDDNEKSKLRTDLEDTSEQVIIEYKYIDTLTVSPLIFPEFPSHKLDKDYKHESEQNIQTGNKPVEDSRICMNLLHDQIERLEKMSEENGDLLDTMIKLVRSGEENGDLKVQWNNLLNLIHELNEESKIPPAPQSDSEISDDILFNKVKNLICEENGSLYGHACIHGMDKLNYAKDKKWQVPLAYMLANIYANSKMNGNPEPINNAIIPYYVQYRCKGIDRINWDLRGIQCEDKNCTYCRKEDGTSSERFNTETNLKKFWGEEYHFRKFPMYDGQIKGDEKLKKQQGKDLQRDATERALKGGNMLAIFPTGGGKSLSFQLPALMQWRLMGALTVVISPLQSLMNDQVDNLDEKGLVGEAVTRNGSQNERKQRAGILQARNGSASMLYISPESLNNPVIKSILYSRTIARFVIDESHCFSQWGMDFRPDYRNIPQFIKELEEAKGLDKLWRPGIPVSCYTATASKNTRDDICSSFGFSGSSELFSLKDIYVDSQRTNLSYHLIKVDRPEGVKPEEMDQDKVFNTKLIKLKELLLNINKNDKKEPIIIYISNTEKTKDIANWICTDKDLNKIGKARPFYGQQPRATKNKTQDMFMNGKCRIIVATSAFGMGVDKDNVRNVIHFGISNSVEDYVQEAGRAGRDNKPADCYLLYMEDEDLAYVEYLSESSKLHINVINEVWKYLKDLRDEKKSEKDLCDEKKSEVGYTISKIVNEVQGYLPTEGRREQIEYVKRIIKFLEDKEYIQSLPDKVLAFPTKINENANKLIKKTFSNSPVMKELAGYVVERISCYKKEGNIKETGELYSDIFGYINKNEGLKNKKITLYDINNLFREMEKDNIITCEDEKEFVINKLKSSDPKKDLELWYFTEWKMHDKLSQRSYNSFEELNADLKADVYGGVKRLKQIYRFWVDHKYISRPKKNMLSFSEYKPSSPSESGQMNDKAQENVPDVKIRIKDRIHKKYANALIIYKKCNESKDFYTLSELQEFFDTDKKPDVLQLEEALDILARTGLLSIDDGGKIFRKKSYALLLKEDKCIAENDFKDLKDYYEKKDKQISMYLPAMTEKMDSEELTQFFHDYFWEDRDKFDKEIKNTLKKKKNGKGTKTSDCILNDEQKAVLDDKDSNIIIVKAGPGSGKTMLMACKAERMIQNKEVIPQSIVILTYTRKAADEIRSRLKGFARGITVTTFHAYAAAILGEPGSIDDVIFERVNNSLENAKNDIDGFLNQTSSGMPELDAVRKKVIIIDEAQDMKKEMYDLVANLYELNKATGNGMKVIAVGDPDQAIFEYSKKDSEKKDYMSQLAELGKDEDKVEIYELNKNYRSGQAIVELSRHYINKDFKEEDVANGFDSKIGLFISESPEKALVNKLLTDLYSLGQEKKEIAVLSFTRDMKNQLRGMITTNDKFRKKDIRIHDLKRKEIEDFTLEKLDEFHAILRRICESLEKSEKGVCWGHIKSKLLKNFRKSYKNSRHCEQAIELVEKCFATMEVDEIFDKEEYDYLLKCLENIPYCEFEKEFILNEDAKSRKQYIDLTFSTIHSAKGRQYDAVYIYHDMYNDNIEKRDSREDTIKELYVAMTRAVGELYIFSDKDIRIPHAKETIKERINCLKKCVVDDSDINITIDDENNESLEDDLSVYKDFALNDISFKKYMNRWYWYKCRYEKNSNPVGGYRDDFLVDLNDLKKKESGWKGFFGDSPQWLQAGVCKARFVRTRYENFDSETTYPGLIWLEIKVDDETDWGKFELCRKEKKEDIETYSPICRGVKKLQDSTIDDKRSIAYYRNDCIELTGIDIRAVVVKKVGNIYRKILLP